MFPELPPELLCIIFLDAARGVVCGDDDWPGHLRLVCRTARDWTHALLFTRIVVRKHNVQSFLALVDSVPPSFFACVESLSVLADWPDIAFDWDVGLEPVRRALSHVRSSKHFGAAFAGVRWLCCSLNTLHVLQGDPCTRLAPTHLAVWHTYADELESIELATNALCTVTHVSVFGWARPAQYFQDSTVLESVVFHVPDIEDYHALAALIHYTHAARRICSLRSFVVVLYPDSDNERVRLHLSAIYGLTIRRSATTATSIDGIFASWAYDIASGREDEQKRHK